MISFHHEIPVQTQFRLPLKLFAGACRCVWGGKGEEKKERFFRLLPPYEALGFAIKGLQNLVILEIFFRRADPIEGAPALLSRDFTLPYVVSGKGIRIHVE